MSDDNHTKVLAFLAGELAREGHQMCVKIELEYTPKQGFRREPIKSWTPAADAQYFEKDPESGSTNHAHLADLAGSVIDLAESHADSYGEGKHRFVLRTTQHLGARATCAFVCLPGYGCGDTDDAAGLGTVSLAIPGQSGEGAQQPISAGNINLAVTTQLMRHLENRDRATKDMMQTFLQSFAAASQQLRDENTALREQLTQAERDRREWLLQIEEARSKDHERQIEAAQVTSKNERTDYAMKKILALLPVAISGLVSNKKDKNGPSGKPAKPSALAMHMSKLFDSLNDEQRDHIESVLDIEQKILLGSIVKAIDDGGDSVLLPTMVHDLVLTLRGDQVRGVMGVLSKDQGTMFVTAMQLAQTQAQRNNDTPAQKPAAETEDA